MWLGTSDGLNRWNKGQITIYRKRSPRGRRGDSLFGGLTAGRDAESRATVREIIENGLPERPVDCLFEDDRGQIWVGTLNGVAVYRSDRFFPVGSVPSGIVFSITGDSAGNIWISHQEGLFHLFQERVVERIPWARLGRREPASALLHDARQGGLWLGFRDGGVAYFSDGRIRASYAGSERLTPGMVHGFYIDRKRHLWAATGGGLSRIQDGRVLTLTSRNGLPCDMVHWMMEDDADSVWLYLACGLVRIARAEFDAWASDPEQQIRTTVFDSSDGVRNLGSHFGYSSVVAKSSDGRLWFLPFGGVSVIDPHHLAFNERPPPVHIEQITANGKTYWRNVSGEAPLSPELPPRVRDLTIDYTALSLVAPEKVRFRFKLEGQDSDWREVVNDRRVQYSNLAPRNYTFRVRASNNSGVWNEDGAVLHFSIAPAYYQTRWFKALVAAGAVAALWAGYLARVAQVARASPATARRTRRRANAHRAGTARHAAAKLPRSAAAIPDRVVPAAGAPGRGQRDSWMVRLSTRRRRSPKGAMPCRDYGPPPSKRTTSRWRSATLGDRTRGRRQRPPTGIPRGRRRRDARAPSDCS